MVGCSFPDRRVPFPVANQSAESTVTWVKRAGKTELSVVVRFPNGHPRLVSQYWRTWCTWITMAWVPGSDAEMWIEPSVMRSRVACSVWDQRTTAPFDAVNPPVTVRLPVSDSLRRGAALTVTFSPDGVACALQAGFNDTARGTRKVSVAAS